MRRIFTGHAKRPQAGRETEKASVAGAFVLGPLFVEELTRPQDWRLCHCFTNQPVDTCPDFVAKAVNTLFTFAKVVNIVVREPFADQFDLVVSELSWARLIAWSLHHIHDLELGFLKQGAAKGTRASTRPRLAVGEKVRIGHGLERERNILCLLISSGVPHIGHIPHLVSKAAHRLHHFFHCSLEPLHMAVQRDKVSITALDDGTRSLE
jgi:hypothetical protein